MRGCCKGGGSPIQPKDVPGRKLSSCCSDEGGSSATSLKPFLCHVLDQEGEILLSAIKTRKVGGMEQGSGAFERDLREAWVVYEPFSWVGWPV